MLEAKITNVHPFGANCEIYNAVMSSGLIANTRDALPFTKVPGDHIEFKSAPFGAAKPPSEFVLLNPEIGAEKIAALVPVLITHNTPSGYLLRDGVRYRKIYAVGYTKAALNEQAQRDWSITLNNVLKSADCELIPVKVNSAAQDLDNALQG